MTTIAQCDLKLYKFFDDFSNICSPDVDIDETGEEYGFIDVKYDLRALKKLNLKENVLKRSKTVDVNNLKNLKEYEKIKENPNLKHINYDVLRKMAEDLTKFVLEQRNKSESDSESENDDNDLKAIIKKTI